MGKPIIEMENVSFRYENAASDVLKGVSLTVNEGEFIAVLGRNGSGKSTMAKLLNALVTPASGTVAVDGLSPDNEDACYEIRTRCGMVFQNPDNQIVSTIVEEDCAFGLENMGIAPAEIRRRVDEALRTVGMEDYALSAPHMLSGGQKQRVAVAGVAAMRPKIIVFDESTAMLDPVGRADILRLARKLNREEGITVVWITHFMEEAVQADRVCVMASGKILMDGLPREIFSRQKEIRDLGLDAPEMACLAGLLREGGLNLPEGILTVEEMAVELCRLK